MNSSSLNELKSFLPFADSGLILVAVWRARFEHDFDVFSHATHNALGERQLHRGLVTRAHIELGQELDEAELHLDKSELDADTVAWSGAEAHEGQRVPLVLGSESSDQTNSRDWLMQIGFKRMDAVPGWVELVGVNGAIELRVVVNREDVDGHC